MTKTSASRSFRTALAKLQRTQKRLSELKHDHSMMYLAAKEENIYPTDRQKDELDTKLDFFQNRQKTQARNCLKAYDRLRELGVEPDSPFDRQEIERLAS